MAIAATSLTRSVMARRRLSIARSRRAPGCLLQGHSRTLHPRVGRVSDQHVVVAAANMPIVARGFVGREQGRVDGQRDLLALAWLELGFGEGAKPLRSF